LAISENKTPVYLSASCFLHPPTTEASHIRVSKYPRILALSCAGPPEVEGGESLYSQGLNFLPYLQKEVGFMQRHKEDHRSGFSGLHPGNLLEGCKGEEAAGLGVFFRRGLGQRLAKPGVIGRSRCDSSHRRLAGNPRGKHVGSSSAPSMSGRRSRDPARKRRSLA